MMSVISSLVVATAYLLRELRDELPRERAQTRVERRIDEMVSDLDAGATDERGVHRERGAQLLAAPLFESAEQRAAVSLIEFDCRGDASLLDPESAIDEIRERTGDHRNEDNVVALDQQAHHRTDRGGLALHGGRDGRLALRPRDRGIREGRDRRAVERGAEPLERVAEALDGAVVAGERHQRFAVAPRGRGRGGHQPPASASSAPASSSERSMNARCSSPSTSRPRTRRAASTTISATSARSCASA